MLQLVDDCFNDRPTATNNCQAIVAASFWRSGG
jgi:hypothetical protein